MVEDEPNDYNERDIDNFSDSRNSYRHTILKRMKSWKPTKPRKIISAAQTFRIENRFNKHKLKRKRRQEMKENQLKMGSGLELQKLKSNAMDMMFENN